MDDLAQEKENLEHEKKLVEERKDDGPQIKVFFSVKRFVVDVLIEDAADPSILREFL